MIIMMSFLLFSSMFYVFFSHFHSKLVVLLCLESLMLLSISVYFCVNPLNSSTLFISLMFSIFMVLDSVFCVSVLISGSRKSSFSQLSFNSI